MSNNDALLSELKRMSRLLALVAVKDTDQGRAVTMLAGAGYTQAEIGSLLGMTANAVGLRLLRMRKGKTSAKPKDTNNEPS